MLKLIHDLSNAYGGEKNTKELEDLIDAKIIDVGMDQSGSGFAIDYKNKKVKLKEYLILMI
jgi:hypothetical protein